MGIALTAWDFGNAQSMLMKMFSMTKEVKYYLASLYVQLLNFSSSEHQYLDSTPPGKVKIMKMFFPKIQTLIEGNEDEPEKIKLRKQFLGFKVEVLRILGEKEAVINLIHSNVSLYEYTLHLDILTALLQEEASFMPKVLSTFLKTIKIQFNDSPIANYQRQISLLSAISSSDNSSNLWDEFLKNIVNLDFSNGHLTLLEQLESLNLAGSDISNLEEDSESNFLVIFLLMNLRYLQKFSDHKNDKFRSKNYILLILDLFSLIPDITTKNQSILEKLTPLITSLINLYTKYFIKTASILRELLHIFKLLPSTVKITQDAITLERENYVEKSEMLSLIDHHLFELELLSQDCRTRNSEELMTFVVSILKQFEQYYTLIYGDESSPKLEAGDRLFVDHFLLTAVDILRVRFLFLLKLFYRLDFFGKVLIFFRF